MIAEIEIEMPPLSCISTHKGRSEKTSLPLASRRQTCGRSPSWARGTFSYRRQGAVCRKLSLRFFTASRDVMREQLMLCRTHLSCFGKGIARLEMRPRLRYYSCREGANCNPKNQEDICHFVLPTCSRRAPGHFITWMWEVRFPLGNFP